MVDVVKTRTDLIERAATELGVKTAMQELSDEDRDTIDALVDPLVQQLATDSVVYIGDTEQIPVEYFLPLAMLLANSAAITFGQAYSGDLKRAVEADLRRLTATKPTFETLRAVYF